MKTKEIISKVDSYVMNTYGRFPVAVKNGKGSWVWDYDGNSYLDFVTGIAVNNLGHSHPEIIKAIDKQSKELIQISNLFYIPGQAELAELLVKNSFADKVFFCNSGAEANEGAIKLARRWGRENGDRYKIVSAKGSFHGRTMGALSATNPKYQKGFKPMLSGFKSVAYGKLGALEKALDDRRVCAVIIEPIQGESGVKIPPNGYLKGVRDICNKKNVLLILDEIQVGLGRTGRLFAYENYGIEPDIMTLAKALGGGIPCGAFLSRDEVAQYLVPGTHGTTLGGNPLAMSTGAAVIKTIIKEGLLDNTVSMGNYFLDGLKRIEAQYKKFVKGSRGKGLILGIEFKTGEIANEVVSQSVKKGLLTILTEQTVMRILPPLNASRKEIDLALKIIRESLDEVGNA